MPYPIPLNNLTEYNARMLTYGTSHSHDLDTPPVTENDYNFQFNDTYYDGAWVFYQIADYLSDPTTWNPVAVKFATWYRDNYVLFTGTIGSYSGGGSTGAVSGYHIFPIGLFENFTRAGTILSKNAALLMSLNAAFSPDSTPLTYTLFPNSDQNGGNGGSREVAYQIGSHLYARKLGQSARARLKDMVDQALAHINMWFVTSSSSYIRPFMVSLTVHDLILYVDNTVALGLTDRTTEIYNAIKIAGTYLKAHLWSETDLALYYTDRIVDDPHDMDPAPDLNLLIVLMYGWLYHQDGDASWITFGDKVFKGGVVGAGTALNPNGAFLAGFGKQFHQNYRVSMRYIALREADPLTVPPSGGGTPIGTPSTSVLTFPIVLPVKRETWAEHFTNNGWATPQDQIDAGYKVYIEPAALTSNLEVIVDLGALITQAATLSIEYLVQTVDLPVTVTLQLATSPDNATYTTFATGQNPVFAQNLRYVKVTLAASGATGRALARIPAMNLKVTLKEIRDGGNAAVGASDTHVSPVDGSTQAGTWIPFNKEFADIKTINVTEVYQSVLSYKVKAYPVDYDVPDPLGFAVVMFRTDTGARIAGTINWSAQGY